MRGFTLIEPLVGDFTIGVVALFLAAVQAAREAAGRAHRPNSPR